MATLTDELEHDGGSAHAVRADATELDRIDPAIDEAQDALGVPSVMVYMASALVLRRPALEADARDFARALDVNVAVQFAWARAVASRMSPAGGGSIVLVGSILGYGGTPGRAAYNTSKGGLIQLVRALAVEWAPLGIRVNGVAPGWVETESLKRTGLDLEPLARRSPSGRLGTPDDIAGPALFLASDLARWVTGVMVPVDGGTTAYLGPGDPPDA
jgi:NAD(P)-dependent dehydrogenase (short-subunit alcohol dehydrogenase family)